MELRNYAAILWRWLWLIVLATGSAAGSSYWASRSTPPVYQATTVLMVGRTIQQTNPSYSDINTSELLARTYAELVGHQPVLEATLKSLGLNASWQGLRGRVNANAVQGTQLLEVSALDTNPQRAKVIADEVARQLISQSPTAPLAQQEEKRQFVEAQVAELQSRIQKGQKQVADLEQALNVAPGARQFQDYQLQITLLQNQINGWQSNYNQFLNNLYGGSTNYLAVLEPAPVPFAPIGPRLAMNALLAGAVGFLLAIGAAFIVEYLDDTVKSPDDLSASVGLASLGAIGRTQSTGYGEKPVTARHPHSSVSESYRTLRTNIQLSTLDRPAKTLLITSPSATEGKSVTAANLAVVMAQAGMKTVLVDSDLRRPMQHRIFQVPNKIGLTSLMLQEEPILNGHLQAVDVQNLCILTSGPLPPKSLRASRIAQDASASRVSKG